MTIPPDILGRTDPVGAKKVVVNRYSLVAPQPLHLAKKVQLPLTGSHLYALFNEHKMNIVRCS